MTDIDILRKASEIEAKPKAPGLGVTGRWSYFHVGASRDDMRRLLDDGLVTLVDQRGHQASYQLTNKGRTALQNAALERMMDVVPATDILEAMGLIIGFDDVKETIARSIEARKRLHFLLEGPPACAKSMILEAVRTTVPKSAIAFGSRTSASGLSDLLFVQQPAILLLDEADKMRMDTYSVCLGLMESGEVVETKSKKTRGVKLDTAVIAACNGSQKMPREFLSRFAAHIRFPEYTHAEFLEVVRGFLMGRECVPEEIADLIGRTIYDSGLRDVRQARAVWNMMTAPTREEVERVVMFKLKYSPDLDLQRRARRQERVLAPSLFGPETT